MNNIIDDLKQTKETFWANDELNDVAEELSNSIVKQDEIEEARKRLRRFRPLIMALFEQTHSQGGVIESPLVSTPKLKAALESYHHTTLRGDLFLKLDSHLPISGSIKARGGIYEVLAYAESLALKAGLITYKDDYSVFATPKMREFLSQYKISVGSTGNLGLSIGIMGSKLGLAGAVHMSSDAREWKKKMLRECGVNVIEYEEDYSIAVANGRKEAQNDDKCHFVDDENSKDLFLGYAVAAKRLKGQLDALDIIVDSNNPLFVYLPCGVGGGPGGVAFGLKSVFGDNVKCFFAEPTHSPCMLLGLVSKKYNNISVGDIGLDNKTAADGLAVGRASALVSKVVQHLIDGCFSVSDERMFEYLALTAKIQGIKLEPSALAGMKGIYLTSQCMSSDIHNATHIVWATGGSMVPSDEMNTYISKGNALLDS